MEVAAAFIKRGGKILICRRPEGKNCAFMWEFPGGKSENDESLEQTLARECMEELDIKITVGESIADTFYEYPGISVHLTLFEARITQGEPRCVEHSGIIWINQEDIPLFEFCPADRKLLENMGLLPASN